MGFVYTLKNKFLIPVGMVTLREMSSTMLKGGLLFYLYDEGEQGKSTGLHNS